MDINQGVREHKKVHMRLKQCSKTYTPEEPTVQYLNNDTSKEL